MQEKTYLNKSNLNKESITYDLQWDIKLSKKIKISEIK